MASRLMKRWVEEYSIPTRARFELALPEGAKFLAAAFYQNQPRMWFAVQKPYCETHAHRFALIITGGELPEEPCEHIATVVGFGIVGHLFEIK